MLYFLAPCKFSPCEKGSYQRICIMKLGIKIKDDSYLQKKKVFHNKWDVLASQKPVSIKLLQHDSHSVHILSILRSKYLIYYLLSF